MSYAGVEEGRMIFLNAQSIFLFFKNHQSIVTPLSFIVSHAYTKAFLREGQGVSCSRSKNVVMKTLTAVSC